MANLSIIKQRYRGQMGIVVSNDFKSSRIHAFIGFYIVDNQDRLTIYGEDMEDFSFTNKDVESMTTLEQGIVFVEEQPKISILSMLFPQIKPKYERRNPRGNKYELIFKNGRRAEVYIHEAVTDVFEQLVLQGI